MSPDFAVLGGGLMGRLIAWQLARSGWPVRLYERGGPDGAASAAHVAAAMLAPLAESVVTEPSVVRLGRASLERWPELLAELPEPVFFQRNGTLILWHAQDRDQAAQFLARLRRLDPALSPDGAVREVRGATVTELEPSLEQRFPRGIYLEGEGQLDNRGVLTALVPAMERAGVRLFWNTEMVPEALEADWVIDCRGLGAKPDLRELRGVRGEVVRVETSELRLNRPVRLLHPRYPLYIAPKPGGIFVIGATQIETEDHSPTSVRSALELLSALYSVHPAFGEARILEMATQCRPALPDNLPRISWDGGRRIRVNVLYRHCFLIAPALLDAALALIQRLLEAGGRDLEEWRQAQSWAGVYRLQEAA